MSEDEFEVEDFFGDVEKGVLARLMDAGGHAVLHSCCGGLIDDVREKTPFCLSLANDHYSHFIPLLRSDHDRAAEEKEGINELPCKECPHQARELARCRPHCPSLANYIKSMPIKIRSDGKINPRPCEDCKVNEFGKNVCAKHCQSIKAIQGGTNPTRGTRNVTNGGRHRRGKQGCL